MYHVFKRTNALIAQLVEQRTENPCVGGSSPPRGTILKTKTKKPQPCAGAFLF